MGTISSNHRLRLMHLTCEEFMRNWNNCNEPSLLAYVRHHGGLQRPWSGVSIEPQPARGLAAYTRVRGRLGVALFQTFGRRLQLTSEGEDLLRQSRRLLADVDLLTERAHALKGGQAGILRTAAAPQMITSLLAPSYRHRWRHPDVEVLPLKAALRATEPPRARRFIWRSRRPSTDASPGACCFDSRVGRCRKLTACASALSLRLRNSLVSRYC